jgi:hypothetical protein
VCACASVRVCVCGVCVCQCVCACVSVCQLFKKTYTTTAERITTMIEIVRAETARCGPG